MSDVRQRACADCGCTVVSPGDRGPLRARCESCASRAVASQQRRYRDAHGPVEYVCPECGGVMRQGKASSCLNCREKRLAAAVKAKTKVCRVCGDEKTVEEFPLRGTGRHRPGSRRNECRACISARERVRRGRPHPGTTVTIRCAECSGEFERVASGSRLPRYCAECATERGRASARAFQFQANIRKYGLTFEAYEALLAAQGGRCALCRTDTPGGQGRWGIDHDHACCPGKGSCGKCVRALLCSNCNAGLGHFHDDSDLMRRAADYVERFREVSETQLAEVRAA